MLTIAIISDIHANLPALDAVLKDIDQRNVDQIFCLGDLVDFAPWPNEVIDRIRKNRITTLMGNHDERIAFDLPTVPLKKHSATETQVRFSAIDYTRQTIRSDNKAYLASLPRECSLSFTFGESRLNLLLVHASPRAIDEYIYENHDEQDLRAMMEAKNADTLVMGHTHLSYIRSLSSATTTDSIPKLAINCGSVGRSKETEPLATYLLITVSAQSQFSPDAMTYELVHVPYPIEQTIEAIRMSHIPDFYAHFLERGHIQKSKEKAV